MREVLVSIEYSKMCKMCRCQTYHFTVSIHTLPTDSAWVMNAIFLEWPIVRRPLSMSSLWIQNGVVWTLKSLAVPNQYLHRAGRSIDKHVVAIWTQIWCARRKSAATTCRRAGNGCAERWCVETHSTQTLAPTHINICLIVWVRDIARGIFMTVFCIVLYVL